MGAVKISEVSKQCTGCGKTRALARFQTYRKNGYLCVKSRCRDCEHARVRKLYKDTPRSTLRAVIRGARARGTLCNLQVRDLMELWDKQEGKCALSGVVMTYRQGRLLLTSVSVDRIVARKGYVKGNVRLVCMAVNALRGSASDMEAYGIAKAFVQKWEESHGRA